MCDGTTRRELLCVGGLSMLGTLTLPQWLQAQAVAQPKKEATAKACLALGAYAGARHASIVDTKLQHATSVLDATLVSDLRLPIDGGNFPKS